MEYNYIIIYKVGSQRQIRAKGEMFSYDVVVDVYPDMVTFTEHTIDNLKKHPHFVKRIAVGINVQLLTIYYLMVNSK